ncbi:nuclear transport factor 2 family protein [Microbacterium alcoholitolerans]|uniref:nuclear transport factor 2 family protein n=1 Tax=unclassified Microbacterium TaxID=2609290 RepID=UPI003D1678FC
MTNTEVLDRARLQDLALAYAEAVDAGDVDRVAGLFTEDAVFRAYDRPRGEAHGRAEIRALMDKLLDTFTGTLHHVSGPRAEFTGDDTAVGFVSLHAWHAFVEDRPDGILWGRYADEYLRTGSGWKIARRALLVHGQQDFAFPWIAPA